MTPADVAALLTAAAAVDDRISPDAARVQAWAAILDADMELPVAMEAVKRHYAERTDPLMPAVVNGAWRSHRRREAERRATEARALPAPSVPPPPELLARMRALRLTRTA